MPCRASTCSLDRKSHRASAPHECYKLLDFVPLSCSVLQFGSLADCHPFSVSVRLRSVERMLEYNTLQPEAAAIVEGHRPLPGWPQQVSRAHMGLGGGAGTEQQTSYDAALLSSLSLPTLCLQLAERAGRDRCAAAGGAVPAGFGACAEEHLLQRAGAREGEAASVGLAAKSGCEP